MKFWDKVKNNGRKVQLQGEIQLLKRERTGRIKQFGVEFYDLLTNDKQKLLGVSAGTLFKGGEPGWKPALQQAREDIAAIQVRKESKQKDLDVLEVKGSHTMPDYTLQQKAAKASRAVADGAKATKWQADMALLDREIKIRKEQFGLEAFDLAPESTATESTTKNPVKLLSKAVASLTPQEQDIQNCIDKAKQDVAKIDSKINVKQGEIHALNDGETEPMMAST